MAGGSGNQTCPICVFISHGNQLNSICKVLHTNNQSFILDLSIGTYHFLSTLYSEVQSNIDLNLKVKDFYLDISSILEALEN